MARLGVARRALLLAACAGWAPVPARAAASAVWVAQSDTGAANEEAAGALREVLAPVAEVHVGLWPHVGAGAGDVPPRLVIALGVAALRGALARRGRDAPLERVPILAGLVPSHAVQTEVPPGTPLVGALVLEQPAARYGELIRLAMPQRRRIGVLVGQPPAGWLEALRRWAVRADRQLVLETVGEDGLVPALRRVLESADVLLATPDPMVYTPASLQNILIASYRRRVPVVSYAPAHARAGAVLALAVTPAQAGRQMGEVARAALRGQALPALVAARDFQVMVNDAVARSLDIALPTAAELEATLRQRSGLEGRA
ncbi:ABC transporter substrate binding protein [Tepidimonas thermarum]|uniref:ABC transporter substrate binding protein n=1 Tax=Tepidimonas thermarum TaxID=335431 RepID=A0A554X0P9_9BURK|nr:ABC transporter substrate binding protein [Tepidimonas thermarum]TSE29365.1 ABC transporter substrate binding protein [Tepidimonas thermarum]